MTLYFPGPYELELVYTVFDREHRLRMNLDTESDVDPGTPFASINVLRRGAAAVSLDTYASTWLDLLKDVWNATNATFDQVNLYKYAVLSFDKDFISAAVPTDTLSAVGTNVEASQSIMTLRTFGGNTMRVTMMEGRASPGVSVRYSDLVAPYSDIADFLLSVDCGFVGRDGTYPLQVLAWHPGQSEAIFKAIYR